MRLSLFLTKEERVSFGTLFFHIFFGVLGCSHLETSQIKSGFLQTSQSSSSFQDELDLYSERYLFDHLLKNTHNSKFGSEFSIFSYPHQVPTSELQNQAYSGSVYHPTLHRIYFIPFGQTNPNQFQTHWHYLDCLTGQIISYPHGLESSELNLYAYASGVYDPLSKRIYLIPFRQASPSQFQTYWHYIDSVGSVKRFAHGLNASDFQEDAYTDGVFDPIQQRIYLIPFRQTDSADFKTHWHYVDCQSGLIERYQHLTSSNEFQSLAYAGGAYDPHQRRIYLIPRGQTNSNNFKTHWHYIEVETGSIRTYEHGISSNEFEDSAYTKGQYSPLDRRIYFFPYNQIQSTNLKPNLHYLDCQNAKVESYAHGLTGEDFNNQPYLGGVYDLANHKIYFMPWNQALKPKLHYFDCFSQSIKAYLNPFFQNDFQPGAYYGGSFDPQSNRIYFAPRSQTSSSNFKTRWHGIQNFSREIVSKHLASHPLFN
jgi:hypothetical protein